MSLKCNRRNLSIDIIIVGTSPGGAAIAQELSRQGKKILQLERGYNASVFPEALDRPTVLTIIAFAKRLAKYLSSK